MVFDLRCPEPCHSVVLTINHQPRERKGDQYDVVLAGDWGWAAVDRLGWVAAILMRMVSTDTAFMSVAGPPTKQTNANRRALATLSVVGKPRDRSVRPLILFFHCEGFFVPFSIAKPTLGGTATPCRCPETHKKSEPSTQPLTQPPHAAISRSHLTQPPHAAKGLTQPLLVPEVGCWGNPLTEPTFGGVYTAHKRLSLRWQHSVASGCPPEQNV